MILDSKTRSEVLKSVHQYRENILKDINLVVRLINTDEKVYTTTLNKWEDDEIIFEAPIEQCDWVIFALPIVLEACFVTNQSIYMTKIEVSKRHQVEGKLRYKGHILQPITKKQQRAHFRLATLCTLQYRIIPEGAEENDLLLDAPFYKGTTVNLSVGGLCMVSDRQLEYNQQLDIQFHFLEHTFDVNGIVLDAGERNPNGTYTHRIRFGDMDARKTNLLSKLIFEKQRLSMQSSKVPLYK